jgi:hypothetical protein
MQLKHLETSTFKTYLSLAEIAKNMALMIALTEKQKKGLKGAIFLPIKAEGIEKKDFFVAPFWLLFSQQRKEIYFYSSLTYCPLTHTLSANFQLITKIIYK